MEYVFLVVPLLLGFVFTKWLAPVIAGAEWFEKITDKRLGVIGNIGCLLLYLGIWGDIYMDFSQFWFLILYCPGCAVLAFSLIRAHDKGAFGGIVLNSAFTVLTFLPFILPG